MSDDYFQHRKGCLYELLRASDPTFYANSHRVPIECVTLADLSKEHTELVGRIAELERENERLKALLYDQEHGKR